MTASSSHDDTPTFIPSERFDRALAKAVELHRSQLRKGSGTPYVGHLLTVAGYVLEDGGSEDEAIAALLHDALEDQYRDKLPGELREEFGESVLEMVEGCSQERVPGEELPWRGRKQRYIDHLADAAPEVIRVSLADKLANVRSMLRDYREEGEELWERFNAPSAQDLLWYYKTLAKCYRDRRPGAVAEEFAHEVGRLRAIASWISRQARSV